MAMVMPAPSSRLLMGLEVMRLSSRSSLPPAIFSRLLDMVFIPYRKKASPPQSVKTEKISMRFSLSNSLIMRPSASGGQPPLILPYIIGSFLLMPMIRHYYICKKEAWEGGNDENSKICCKCL